MMAQLILLLQFKTFNMKLYFIIVSLLVVGFSNAQVLPQALIVNNNAYPTTFSSNTSLSFQSVNYPATLTNPALKSNFSFNFSNTTPYTMQFMVSKKFNAYSSGFIGFTTAEDGLSYSTGCFLFYEFNK